MVQHPYLENATGHVILRGCEQWRALLGDGLGTTLSANARNRVYPSLESMMASMQSFACGLQTLTFPVFTVQDGRFVEPSRLFDNSRVQILLNDIVEVAWGNVVESVDKCPWLSETQVEQGKDALWGLRMCGGIWDKQPNRNFAMCRILDDLRTCDGVLFGTRFKLYGWAPTPMEARISVVYKLLARARHRGVLQDALQAKRASPGLKLDNLLDWAGDLFPLTSEDDDGSETGTGVQRCPNRMVFGWR